MESKVIGIYYKPGEINCGISVDHAYLKQEYGIEGDVHAGRKGRHVSILMDSTREKIRNLPVKGLCTERFKENITLSGRMMLCIGEIIRIGDAAIRIKEIGKRCFKDCDIYNSGIVCPLREVVFGDVIESGEIKTGDEVVIIE